MIRHFFKVRIISVIRILNCSLSFRIVRSKQLHFSSRSSISGPKFLQILHITIIKSHYNTEVAEIIFVYLSCSVWIRNSMFLQYFQATTVRSESTMEIKYSGAIDFPISAVPSFSRRCLRIASAEGERHIFPRQTNRIFRSFLSAILNEKDITLQ